MSACHTSPRLNMLYQHNEMNDQACSAVLLQMQLVLHLHKDVHTAHTQDRPLALIAVACRSKGRQQSQRSCCMHVELQHLMQSASAAALSGRCCCSYAPAAPSQTQPRRSANQI